MRLCVQCKREKRKRFLPPHTLHLVSKSSRLYKLHASFGAFVAGHHLQLLDRNLKPLNRQGSSCTNRCGLFFCALSRGKQRCPPASPSGCVRFVTCDMNASLNVLLYLAGIVFEAGSSRPPPPGAPLCFPLFPSIFHYFFTFIRLSLVSPTYTRCCPPGAPPHHPTLSLHLSPHLSLSLSLCLSL